MTHAQRKVGIILSLCFIMTLLISSGVFATTVFSNTHVWQDKYLASVYAGIDNASILTFQNLADAQLKIKSVAKDDEILLLESTKKPVVKNFKSVLSINGYTNIETITYDSYIELQEIILSRVQAETSAVVPIAVLDPKFGVEAIVIAPLLQTGKTVPLFLTEDSVEKISSELKSDGSHIIAGRFPIRMINKLKTENTDVINGIHERNVAQLMERILVGYTDIWGTLMRPDMTDLTALGKETPIFLFFGSVDETSELVKNSQIQNFEVIGGRLSDTAKSIEQESGRDLRFLLKYGRTITQVKGLEGEILSVDSENFPFPFVLMEIVGATYYEENNKLALSFKNTGNVDSLIYSNVEFGTQALTDNYTYAVPAGETITVSYDVEPESVNEITINTQYGDKVPLLNQIEGDDGRSFVKMSLLKKASSLQTELKLTKAQLDTAEGILYITVENLADASVTTHIQFPINETLTIASTEVTVLANEKKQVPIPVPYLSDEVLVGMEGRFVAFQGKDQTIYIDAQFLGITEKSTGLGIMIIIIVVIVLLVLAGIFIALKKKNSGSSYNRRRR